MGLARLLKPTNVRTDGLSIGISRRAFLVTTAVAGGVITVLRTESSRCIAPSSLSALTFL